MNVTGPQGVTHRGSVFSHHLNDDVNQAGLFCWTGAVCEQLDFNLYSDTINEYGPDTESRWHQFYVRRAICGNGVGEGYERCGDGTDADDGPCTNTCVYGA